MTNLTDQNPPTDRRTIMGFSFGYWMLNSIEMFERMGYPLVR